MAPTNLHPVVPGAAKVAAVLVLEVRWANFFDMASAHPPGHGNCCISLLLGAMAVEVGTMQAAANP